MLTHKEADVRRLAIEALESIGRPPMADALGFIAPVPKAAVPALTEMLTDQDKSVRCLKLPGRY